MNCKKIFYSLSTVVFVFSYLSCDRPTKEASTQLNLIVTGFENKNSFSPMGFNPDGNINPTSINDISCIGLFVSGPEDFLSRNTCILPATGNSFSVGYFTGATYIGASTSTSMTFDISSGRDRVLRLIGFTVNTAGASLLTPEMACSQFMTNKNYEQYLSDPYILAAATELELPAGGTKEVSMNATFLSSRKIGECSGPNFGGNISSGGAPTQLRMKFQDEFAGAVSPIYNLSNCIGLRIELRDANNNIATSPSSRIINLNVQNPEAGTFYDAAFSSNIGCNQNVATPLVATAGVIPLTFAPGQNTYTLFFKPIAGASTYQFVATESTGTMASTLINFNFTNGTSNPIHYQIYDYFNNRTTHKITPAMPMAVKRNECRVAAVVGIDSLGNPARVLFGGGSMKGFFISTSAASGDVSIYDNYTNCTTNTAGVTSLLRTYGPSGAFENFPFAYKINSATLDNFSFTVSNDLSQGQVYLGSGDLTSGSHTIQVMN